MRLFLLYMDMKERGSPRITPGSPRNTPGIFEPGPVQYDMSAARCARVDPRPKHGLTPGLPSRSRHLPMALTASSSTPCLDA